MSYVTPAELRKAVEEAEDPKYLYELGLRAADALEAAEARAAALEADLTADQELQRCMFLRATRGGFGICNRVAVCAPIGLHGVHIPRCAEHAETPETKELVELRARAAAAVEVLRRVQWGYPGGGMRIRECPCCGCPKGGIHSTMCDLAALLAGPPVENPWQARHRYVWTIRLEHPAGQWGWAVAGETCGLKSNRARFDRETAHREAAEWREWGWTATVVRIRLRGDSQ
jgi:hypothetical protein